MIVVYHHPRCSKSREAVRLVRQAGHRPVLIDYRAEGWTRGHLLGLFAAAGMTPREALRAKDAASSGIDHASLSDESLVAEMVRHPALVERPFVCAPGGVRLCRPPERVLEIVRAEGPVFDGDGAPLAGPEGGALA